VKKTSSIFVNEIAAVKNHRWEIAVSAAAQTVPVRPSPSCSNQSRRISAVPKKPDEAQCGFVNVVMSCAGLSQRNGSEA